MNHLSFSSMWRGLLAGVLLTAVGLSPRAVRADPVYVTGAPKFIFYIQNSATMANTWMGISGGRIKYQVVADAIEQVARNAPQEIHMGAVFTKFQNIGKLAHLASGRDDLIDAINTFIPNTANAYQGAVSTASVTWGRSYQLLIEDYLENTCEDPTTCPGWGRAVFDDSCSTVHVIAIGDALGFNDSFVSAAYRAGYTGNWTTPTVSRTYLDDLANYAATNDMNSVRTGNQYVVTHAIQLDSIGSSSDIQGLYAQTAIAGGGLYFAATQPSEVATSIWQIITDAFQGMYARSGPMVSPELDHLFQGYFEVIGGNPLFRGHLKAFQLEEDPTSDTYGQIIAGPGVDGELWDAGQLLASRLAEHAEENAADPTVFDYNNQRGIYTNYEDSGFPFDSAPAALQPFDSSEVWDPIGGDGDLVDLLVPQQAFDITKCDALEYDFDNDCDVDYNDAQMVVDFLRGVPDYPYGSFGSSQTLTRGNWKLGSIQHSVMAYVPADPKILTSKTDFYNFLVSIEAMGSMLYIAANDGALHAFNVPELADGASTDPDGGWEWWAYIPRHILYYNSEDVWHEVETRAIEQKLAGETYTNDGALNMEYVWMDGVCNNLPTGDPDYCTQASGDGIKAENGSEWHRILVATMGQASRHAYALDITDPQTPKFLWEIPSGDGAAAVGDTDAYEGWGRGLTTSRPTVGVVYDSSGAASEARWVAFWGSGAPPATALRDGGQYQAHPNLYMVDLLKPTGTGSFDLGGFPAPVATANSLLLESPDPDTDSQSEYSLSTTVAAYGAPGALYGSPSAVDVDGDGGLDVVYIGDRAGQLYKYVMNPSDLNAPTSCLFSTPPAGADVASNTFNLYYRPAVTYDLNGDLRLFYGTGSPDNLTDDDATGYLYMYTDPNPFGCDLGVAASCDTDGLLTLEQGEKLVGAPVIAGGVVYFTTYVADADLCVLGQGYLYGISVSNCDGALLDYDGDSYTVEDDTRIPIDGIPSEVTFANDSIYVSSTIPGDAPSVMNPVRIGNNGSVMNRFNFANWRNVF